MPSARFSAPTSRRGIILLYTLLVIGALVFVASLFLDTYKGMLLWSRHSGDAIEAHAAAGAGLGDGLYQLAQDHSWTQGLQQTQSSGATYSVTFDQIQSAIPYSINNARGNAAVAAPDGRIVPKGFVYLRSTGRFGLVTRHHGALVNCTTSDMEMTARWED